MVAISDPVIPAAVGTMFAGIGNVVADIGTVAGGIGMDC